MRIPNAILAAALGLAALLAFGCQPAPTELVLPPPEVTVATPEVRTVTEDAYYTGKTASTDVVDLRARVQGFLETAPFREGDFVKKDQVLFTIEREQFEAALAAAEAKKQQSEARLKLAEANLVRANQLVGDKAITVEEYQTRIAERDAAKAQIAHDEADIRQAQINLDYTVIHSPIDGRVSRRSVDPGNLVGSGESTLLATVVGMNPMYVYFDVSEKAVMDLIRWVATHGKESLGDSHEAHIQLPGEEGYPHKGQLDYLDNRVDPTTGTAVVRAVFPNDKGLLYPGVYAQVRIPGRTIENAVIVEQQAIGTDLDGKYLLVVKPDNLVERRRVTLGPMFAKQIVVLKGLEPAERYIVVGLQKARPGSPVRPVDAPKPEPKPEPKSEPNPQRPSNAPDAEQAQQPEAKQPDAKPAGSPEPTSEPKLEPKSEPTPEPARPSAPAR
ncbi:MAG: efflux RND transporter periplasmic adaptor subunit [Patescibacteria group bacterium]|nr:efflux RND transporter periplasmic adaptor subunit [Patescibacteria group bacterium]